MWASMTSAASSAVSPQAMNPHMQLMALATTLLPAWSYDSRGSTSVHSCWGAMASSARVQLGGPLVVEIDGRLVTRALPGQQGRALVGFLAAHRRRAHSRDELVEALWPAGAPAGVL